MSESPSLPPVLKVLRDELFRLLLADARDRVLIHGGAVGWGGSAVIFPGDTLSGKTTLTRALLAEGATLYSDDLIVLDSRGRVHPYPCPLLLRDELRRASVGELGIRPGATPLPVGLVALTQYRPQARWRPRTVLQGEAILGLLAHTPAASTQPHRVLATLRRATSQAILLKGLRGEAADTARSLLACE